MNQYLSETCKQGCDNDLVWIRDPTFICNLFSSSVKSSNYTVLKDSPLASNDLDRASKDSLFVWSDAWSWNMPAGTNKFHENSHWGYSLSSSTFEPGTSHTLYHLSHRDQCTMINDSLVIQGDVKHLMVRSRCVLPWNNIFDFAQT